MISNRSTIVSQGEKISCAEDSGLRGELHQTKPFQSAAHEATLGLLRTAALMRHRLSIVIECEGISHEQYNVLRILRGSEGGMPTLDVADRLIEPNPAITRLMDKLENKGLIVRQRCSKDRRRVFCTITQKGLHLLKRLDPKVEATGERSVAGLSDPELEQLSSFLERVRRSVTQTDPESSYRVLEGRP